MNNAVSLWEHQINKGTGESEDVFCFAAMYEGNPRVYEIGGKGRQWSSRRTFDRERRGRAAQIVLMLGSESTC